MEVLILILVIAVVVGFFIVNDSGAKALAVLDEAEKNTPKPEVKPTPVKAVKKPAPNTTKTAAKPTTKQTTASTKTRKKK